MPPSAVDLSNLLQGEFTLEEKLGGQVYRARRRRDGRDLAVRIVRPASPLLAAEFVSLAESASRVKHPTLANVEEFGRMGDEACYIASEFVKGQKLDEWADAVGIPPLAQVIELVRRLCIGLQAAARSGVAHDALNPRNVLVIGSSKSTGMRTPIKLLDIGIPALLYDHARDQKAVRFMAPEQLQVLMRAEPPETFRCSETMNVYSCGSLLYYLATGGPPHAGTAPSELLASQAAGRLAPPIRINPQISPSLNAVVLRALAIDPGERYASVAELGEALANVAISVPMYSLRPAGPAPASRTSVPAVPAANSQIEPQRELAKQVPWGDDDPPTFKTSRIAELEAAAHEDSVRTDPPPRPPSGPLEDEKPTVPPPASSAPAPVVMLDTRDSISGVAPIGLFSSAPPLDDGLRSSLPPAPPMAAGRASGAPLAAFSQPPPAADGGERISAPPAQRAGSPRMASGQFPRGSTPPEHSQPSAAAEPAARPATDPGRISEPPRKRAQRRSALKIALPLAAAACLAAFFTVRGLLAPEPDASLAADGGGRVTVVAEPHATAEPRAPVQPVRPANPPAASAPEAPAVQPQEVASPFGELIPDGNSANAPRGRDWKEWRDNRDARERHRGARNASHASNNDGAKDAKDDSSKLDEGLHQPPVPEPSEVESEPAVARAKQPASPPPAEAAEAPTPTRPPESALRIALVPDRPPPPPLPLQAKAQISQVTVRGSLPTSLVRRAVERIRSQFETCYTRAAQGAGHNGFGELIVDVQIDERGRAREPHVHGGALPHLDTCVAEAAAKLISEKAPDTGTVTASWKVAFSP